MHVHLFLKSTSQVFKNVITFIKVAFITLCCSLLFSCKKNIAALLPPASDTIAHLTCPLPAPVVIQVGYSQTELVLLCDDQPLAVNFSHVIEESRCPVGVYCPWAGRAIAGFTFSFSSAVYEVELGKTIQFNLNGNTMNTTLTALEPHPVYNIPYDVDSYVATLAFSSP